MLPSSQPNKVLLTAILGFVWLITLGSGLRSLLRYETTPGAAGRSPESWPQDSQIVLATHGHTLIMLAHPYCPCTRASVNQLAEVMAGTKGKLRAYVLFLKPKNSGPDWEDTELRRTAAAIPGVTVVTDFEGSEARRFGAETSGHTLLFDSNGRRLFSGGITASRGHAGGNAGESAIVTLVNGGTAARSSTFVFGCGLTSSKDPPN